MDTDKHGFNLPQENTENAQLLHPLGLDRGESDATLAHRMGEGLGGEGIG